MFFFEALFHVLFEEKHHRLHSAKILVSSELLSCVCEVVFECVNWRIFSVVFFWNVRARKRRFKNITMNERERATGDEVISVLVCLMI